uniref:Uncharacterized protein n=1 Tax=Glossina palpalis gambiensis TaxID=67801 RepID=A0A1B0BLH6_9MUSC
MLPLIFYNILKFNFIYLNFAFGFFSKAYFAIFFFSFFFFFRNFESVYNATSNATANYRHLFAQSNSIRRCDIIGTAELIEIKEAQMHSRLARKPSFRIRSLSIDKISGNSTLSGQKLAISSFIRVIVSKMPLNVSTTFLILVKFCIISSRAGAHDFAIICMTKSAYDLKSKTPFSTCCLMTVSSSTSFMCSKVRLLVGERI